MLESLERGELIVFDRPLKISAAAVQSVRAGSGFGHNTVVIDWDRRVVWIEKKTDSWMWVPFDRIAYGVGAGPTAPAKAAPRK